MPSLLFITNKYLSTQSLAPCCFTVIGSFCHLFVLSTPPPLPPPPLYLDWLNVAVPFNSVVFWGGVATRRPRAKPPCVVSHILWPHLKASPSQAGGFFMHNPKNLQDNTLQLAAPFPFFTFSFVPSTPTQTLLMFEGAHLLNERGRSPPRPLRPLWQELGR